MLFIYKNTKKFINIIRISKINIISATDRNDV